MTQEDTDASELLREAADIRDQHLMPAMRAANEHNPAALMYALLDSALQVAQAHFPEHAESVYASATRMVFEAHYGPTPS